MPDGPLSLILRHLRQRFDGIPGDATDDQLLDRFARRHEEGAFTTLMDRHGPMVLSVCRRVLPQSADVEDAFQATFLTLVRKAGSIRSQTSIAGWLYRVAHHAAIRAKTDAARRRARERRAEDRPTPQPAAEAAWRELQEVLGEELARLPDKYRAPLVLCYLEGKSHEEAADQLGWPAGTVKGRLARARSLLRGRLARRGLGTAAGSFATALAVNTPAHAVPASLFAATLRTALLGVKGLNVAPTISALADGLARMLMLARFRNLAKVGLACSLAMLLIVAGGMLARALWDSPASTPPVADLLAPPPAPRVALDGFGDPLPRGALARMGTVRLRLGSPVYRFAYSHDGQTLAAGGDRTVFLWRADTGAEIRQLIGHENRVLGVAFSPDGRTLASSSADQTVRLWNLDTGLETRCLKGHQATVGAVLFSPDGRQLVSGSSDRTLRLWDVASGAEIRRLGGDSLSVTAWPVAFLPDNRTVATRDLPGTLRTWDSSTGEELRWDWLPKNVSAVAFAANGTTMAAARGENPSIQLFELPSGKELQQFRGHRAAIDYLAFSPDDKTLASSSADGSIRFWEVETAKELGRAATGQPRHSGLVFSPNGATLAVGWDTMLRLWETSTGRELATVAGHRGQVRSVAFLPDGQTLVSTGTDKTIRRWDFATGREQGHWQGPTQDSAALASAFAPNGELMALGSIDYSIHLRDLATGALMRQCRGHKEFVAALAFAPDGGTLASASWDKTLVLWEVATGQELLRLQGHPNPVLAVAFSPDGKLVASGSTDGTLRIWDVDTGKTLHECGGELGWIRSVAFSPDGKTVAAAAGTHGTRGTKGLLALWDVATGVEQRRWEAHAERTCCVAFSPDGSLLASGGGDHAIRLWEPATGRQLPPLEGHRGAVIAVAFSADGRHLASASMDTTALVWPMENRMLISR